MLPPPHLPGEAECHPLSSRGLTVQPEAHQGHAGTVAPPRPASPVAPWERPLLVFREASAQRAWQRPMYWAGP